MRRWRTWGLIVTLLLGLGLAARAGAEPPTDDEKKTPDRPAFRSASIWDKWFGIPDAPPPRPAPSKTDKDKDKDKDKDVAKKPAAPKKISRAEQTAADREREEKDYLRRQAVCDKLREIAQQSKDEEMERKVRQLDERIWAVYSQHTSKKAGAEDAPDDADKSLAKKPGRSRGRATDSTVPDLSIRGRPRQSSVEEERP